jgi:uncharacterized protein YbaR (Trm112 family)
MGHCYKHRDRRGRHLPLPCKHCALLARPTVAPSPPMDKHQCPMCRHEFETPSKDLGDVLSCPMCHTQLKVVSAGVLEEIVEEDKTLADVPTTLARSPGPSNWYTNYRCPACKRTFETKTQELGTKLSCLTCGAQLKVTDAGLEELVGEELEQIPCSVKGCSRVYVVPVGESISKDFKFLCRDHAPQNKHANAKRVPSSAITPEIHQEIEEQLTTAPNTAPEPKTVGEVETSMGTKTIDIDSDVDDAADITDRNKKRNTQKIPGPPKKEPAAQPAYLKSVTHPVVPTSNPAAPFGYDDNDRPIGMPVGRPYVTPVQTGTVVHPVGPCSCGRMMCKHCHPENIMKTTVLYAIDHDFDTVQVKSVSEASLRRMLGLGAFNPHRFSDDSYRFISYPQLFSLTRTQLIELLDKTVTTEPTFSGEKVLKPTQPTINRIAEIEAQRDALEARYAELKRLIKESEDIINGLSVRIMKLRRPEDILDKRTREKFKREETKKIEDYKAELKEIRKTPVRLQKLRDRLAQWGQSPDDYEVVQVEQQVPVLFRDRFRAPVDFNGDLPLGHDYGIDGYVQLVYKYDGAESIFKGWKKFENEIILQAIGWELIRPSTKLLKTHPSLGQYLPQRGRYLLPQSDTPEADETENALIIKTGGAAIGGGIYGNGVRGNQPRALESFDKYNLKRPAAHGIGEYGGAPADNWFGGDSGDMDERPGDE